MKLSLFSAALLSLGCLIALGLMPFSGVSFSEARTAAPPSTPDPHLQDALFTYTGPGKCGGAAGCHGRATALDAEDDIFSNEYWTWLVDDKRHSESFATLSNERSLEIARNLGIKDPTQDERCLTCHTISVADYQDDEHVPEVAFASGVSCEACHGPAEDWIREHHNREEWRSMSREGREALGFMHTEDIVSRARSCVGCHVGAAPKDGVVALDANHEIMAAGHPRLDYEFREFHSRMPSHWRERGGGEGLEARIWAIGQVVTAEAALDLLRHRAESAATGGAWPEFADYDCFACHHDLRDPSWQQGRKYPGRTPGALPWGDWYQLVALIIDRDVKATLAELETALAAVYPDAGEVARLATRGRDQLARWLEKNTLEDLNEETMRGWLRELASLGDYAMRSWDSARQLTLAVNAVYLGLPSRDDALAAEIAELVKASAFDGDEAEHESPYEYNGDSYNEKLAKILERLR